MIQHDMMMWDHGNPVTFNQALDADVDVEFQLNSAFAEQSAQLGLALINANRLHATDYPAVLSNAMSNTDSTPFMNETPAVSPSREPAPLRDRQRSEPALAPDDGPVRDLLRYGLHTRFERGANDARRTGQAGGDSRHALMLSVRGRRRCLIFLPYRSDSRSSVKSDQVTGCP